MLDNKNTKGVGDSKLYWSKEMIPDGQSNALDKMKRTKHYN